MKSVMHLAGELCFHSSVTEHTALPEGLAPPSSLQPRDSRQFSNVFGDCSAWSR